mmetsp:Transcript_12966/g.21172  ORF Transcript_12966/g.21172 Transcript_12966/m.21172 type:complete len:110 (+) Transcript_12966:157-486(+)
MPDQYADQLLHLFLYQLRNIFLDLFLDPLLTPPVLKTQMKKSKEILRRDLFLDLLLYLFLDSSLILRVLKTQTKKSKKVPRWSKVMLAIMSESHGVTLGSVVFMFRLEY